MEADLLGIKKASSGPVQKSGKNVEKSQPLAEPARSAKKTTVTEKGDACFLPSLLKDTLKNLGFHNNSSSLRSRTLQAMTYIL